MLDPAVIADDTAASFFYHAILWVGFGGCAIYILFKMATDRPRYPRPRPPRPPQPPVAPPTEVSKKGIPRW